MIRKHFPIRFQVLALACLFLVPVAFGCSGEEPPLTPPDDESEPLREDHAEWLEGAERITLTLRFNDGCQQQVEPLELTSPTELRTTTFIPADVVACTLAFTSYTYELDAPEGTSRDEPVEILVDDRAPITLAPPTP